MNIQVRIHEYAGVNSVMSSVMLATVVFDAVGGLEDNLFACLYGNLLAGLRVEAATFVLVLDIETAKVGNGNLFLCLAQTIGHDAEYGVYCGGGIGFGLACTFCYG